MVVIHRAIEAMLRSHQYEAVDILLDSVDPSEGDIDELLTLTSSVFPFRGHLKRYNRYISRLRHHVESLVSEERSKDILKRFERPPVNVLREMLPPGADALIAVAPRSSFAYLSPEGVHFITDPKFRRIMLPWLERTATEAVDRVQEEAPDYTEVRLYYADASRVAVVAFLPEEDSYFSLRSGS